MADSADIASLIYKHVRNDLSVAERARLESWINESDINRRFFEETTATGHLFNEAIAREQEDKEIKMDEVWQRLSAMELPAATPVVEPRVIRLRIVKYIVAASIILFVIAGAYWLLRPRPASKDITATNATNVTRKQTIQDVAPKTNTPMLTLADGTNILLDSAKKGALAIQGNTNVVKNDSGHIVYTQAGNAHGELLYNTITVPKGANVVSLTLADGSKVWLDAASSIHYPAAFSGDERKVDITGEAYFEVTHNEAMPFRVSRGNVEVEVLGTHFNVNAFSDEQNIKVTLLQGSVKVIQSATKQSELIKPGQQAVASPNGKIRVNANANTEAVMAWKNGFFMFNNTGIKSIMHQIERWYDVEVHYEGDVKHLTFTGQISRYSNVSKVLEMMEVTGTVHFRIEDRKIYVKP